MSDFDDYRDKYEADAGTRLAGAADWIAERKKALAAVVGSGIAAASSFLGADSPVVVGLIAVATVIGVYAVPNTEKQTHPRG